MTPSEAVNCPTCKSDDCVESSRQDSCSACGWTQYVPLLSDRFQREGKCKCEYKWRGECPVHEQLTPPEKKECECGLTRNHVICQPTPSECICGGKDGTHDGFHPEHRKPSREVELDTVIKEFADYLGWASVRAGSGSSEKSAAKCEKWLRELVALARKEK